MKNMKKLAAIVLALVMVLSLTATALATDETLPKDDSNTSAVAPAVTGTNIDSITYKVYFNENKGTVAHPAATFTYTLATGTAVANKGIEAGDIAKVGFDTVGTVTKNVAWTVNDTDVSKDVKVVFGTYTKSGIYRYNIEQTAITGAMADAGIISEDGNSAAAYTMYLDVYVNNTLKVIGVVLAKNEAELTKVAGDSAATPPTDDVMQYVGKVDGFRNKMGDNTNPDDPTDSGEDPTDDLPGYKLTITKTVSGSMADPTYKFPFKVSTTGNSATDGLNIKVVGTTHNDDAKVDVPTLDANGYNTTVGAALDGTVKIAATGSVTLCGLPKNVAFEIAEKVDATEGYTVTITKNDADFASAPTVTNNTGVVTNAVDNTKISGAMNGVNTTIGYTNTRTAISPTGVILRVAPFALILAVGCFFFLVAKRRKDEDEVEA